MLITELLHELRIESKKALETRTNSIEDLYLSPYKRLALDLVININKLHNNCLQALVFISDTSSYFDTNIINPSRARVASVVDCCQKTVSRATNRLQEEGFIKKKNTCVHIKKDVCRNKFTEIDITPFKKILSFIYKYLPKKHHKLILLFSALRLINISSVPDVNNKLKYNKSESITSKETGSLGSENTKSPKSFSCLPISSSLLGNFHTSTASIARDRCLDWKPSIKPPIPPPPFKTDIVQDWIIENEYIIAMQYRNKDSEYWVDLKHELWSLKEKRISKKRRHLDFQRYKSSTESFKKYNELIKRERELRRN